MAQLGQNMPVQTGGARGGPGNRTPARVPVFEIDNVRSYMFEVETKEVLHIDRLGADDIARAIERLAVGVDQVWIWVGSDRLTMKLSEHWRVKIMRDGAVVIKVTDYVLVADDKFLLLTADKDGWYVPVVKGNEITWGGTEEYLTPAIVRRLVKETLKRVLERAQWL